MPPTPSRRATPRRIAPLALALLLATAPGAGCEGPKDAPGAEDAADNHDVVDAANAMDEDAPAKAADGGVPGGFAPASALFDPLGVHVVDLELPEADWAAILANAKDVKLPRAYHKAAAVIDGVRYENVGLKNFGDGSQQENPGKPNVRIKFNVFNTKGRGPDKERNLRLKASGGDPSFAREPLFDAMLRAIGVAAPRHSFARVRVNGEVYGLYQLFEHADKRMFKHFFGNTDGLNYDVEKACVGLNCPKTGCGDLATVYEADHDVPAGQAPDFSPLIALASAIDTAPDATLLTQLGTVADLDNLLGVYAMEAMASELDGIIAGGTNYELYQDTSTGRLHVIRGGADSTFSALYPLDKPWGPPNNWCSNRHDRLYQRAMAIPELGEALHARMKKIQCGPFAKGWFLPWLEKLRKPLVAELKADPKTLYGGADAVSEIGQIADYMVARGKTATALLGPCP